MLKRAHRGFINKTTIYFNHPFKQHYSLNVNRNRTDLIVSAIDNIKVTNSQDWDKVREFIFSQNNKNYVNYTKHNIDGLIMAAMSRLNRLDLAQSYIKYLEQTNVKPNLATMGRYLQLIYQNNNDKVTKAQEEDILNICHEIQQNNPVLDANTMDHIANALSLTKEWRKGVGIMDEIKKTASVSSQAYSALAAAAFLHKEEELAWNLLSEALAEDKKIFSVAFLSYIKTIKRQRKKENILKSLEKLFLFLKENEILCHEDVIDSITKDLNMGQKYVVKSSGHCENCTSKLAKLELTDEEFSTLKGVFFKSVLIGRDVFTKSTPQEVEKFQKFVGKMQKYDVVLDGLNIAFSTGTDKGPHFFSKILATVVSHFAKQQKSVLMLGRAHMLKWPKNNWEIIGRNCDIFLTQNISQDDPYLLYCALHSGKDTIVVSRDLMRGHKFLLKERKYKVLFDRWLSQRQYHLLNVTEKGVFFKKPPLFSPVAQKNNNVWHVPYDAADVNELDDKFHKSWLCIDHS